MGLARLTHRKANPGGAVKVGAESAMHFNLDRPGWVCYHAAKLEATAILQCGACTFRIYHIQDTSICVL